MKKVFIFFVLMFLFLSNCEKIDSNIPDRTKITFDYYQGCVVSSNYYGELIQTGDQITITSLVSFSDTTFTVPISEFKTFWNEIELLDPEDFTSFYDCEIWSTGSARGEIHIEYQNNLGTINKTISFDKEGKFRDKSFEGFYNILHDFIFRYENELIKINQDEIEKLIKENGIQISFQNGT
ncbi:MAG: hypothetical protein Q7J16_08695 [Candidatus Cloacimonadales bacterium]|nr:hypothetical protein [Candidatus Cloacimonadales bacterium]